MGRRNSVFVDTNPERTKLRKEIANLRGLMARVAGNLRLGMEDVPRELEKWCQDLETNRRERGESAALGSTVREDEQAESES